MDQAGFRDWLCCRLVAESRDAIIFADKDGLIRLWNAGAEAMFGYQAAEMEGHSLDRIIPDPLRARHDEGFRRVMATGESRYAADLLAVPGLRKDGVRISLEFTITLIKDDEGMVLGAAAIIRDVTIRWQREREMKKRLTGMEGQGGGEAKQGGNITILRK
jgi:PAS domain S-box-containing protein